MQFKPTVLSSACAAAFLSASGVASAVCSLPGDPRTAVPDITVFISGASAPQRTIGAVAADLFVTPVTFFDDGGTGGNATTDDGTGYRSYLGCTKDTTAIPVAMRDKIVRIDNRAAGGSVFGVDPVARAQSVENLTITVAACPTINSGIYRCTAPTSTVGNLTVPDAGVSDIGPKFFKSPQNVELGAGQLTDTELGRFAGTTFPLNGLGFGVVATRLVDDDVNFSRQNYLGLLNGGINDWQKVDSSAPTGTGVVVCRRHPGSGTQAMYNLYFGNFPCGSSTSLGVNNAAAPLGMRDSSGGYSFNAGTTGSEDILEFSATGITIVENSSSGQVRLCLVAAQTGGVHLFTGPDYAADEGGTTISTAGRAWKVDFGGAARRAIGTLSLDSAGSGGDGTTWDYRSLGGGGRLAIATQVITPGGSSTATPGVVPSRVNMKTGAYDFVSEITGQYRNVTVGSVAPLTAPANASKKTVVDELFTRLGDSTKLIALSGAVGFANMGIPGIGTNVTSQANTMNGSRGGNMCAPQSPG